MKILSERQECIVRAALEIIARRGIRNLTTKNLARAVGVSEPALYRHFKSKHEVLVSIVRHYRRTVMEILERHSAAKGPRVEAIGSIYGSLFREFTDRPELSMVVFTEELFRHDAAVSKEALDTVELMHAHILGMIQAGARKGEIRTDISAKHLAWMVMGTMRMLVARWRMSGHSFNLPREGALAMKSIQKTIGT